MRESGPGVLQDGVERTRENTPVPEEFESAQAQMSFTSNGDGAGSAANGALGAAGTLNNDSSNANSQQYNVSAATSQPSYFPPYTHQSSSNGTIVPSHPQPSSSASPVKHSFPSSLLSSRDKSSILGSETPPNRTLCFHVIYLILIHSPVLSHSPSPSFSLLLLRPSIITPPHSSSYAMSMW